MSLLNEVLGGAWSALVDAVVALAIPAGIFCALALIVKRSATIDAAYRAAKEVRTNLLIYLLDSILLLPVLAIFSSALSWAFVSTRLSIVSPDLWAGMPTLVVIAIGVVAGDFIGYWRHRLEHCQLLWPSHAIHHSDTEMTWLALFRFHPINRISTVMLDAAFLLLLGLPPVALVANGWVRHYYGMLIHADLPWTYGRLNWIFVSPVMHRWHHANDPVAFNTNYATVFSVFDRMFGTYRVPGLVDVPLGVSEDMGKGLVGQMLHPFRPSSYRFATSAGRARSRRPAKLTTASSDQ